jgi:photosystem II stability/assembly factor-like uncharacterized protein
MSLMRVKRLTFRSVLDRPTMWALFLVVGLVACKSPTPTPPAPTPSPSPTPLPSAYTPTPTLPPTHTPTPPPLTIPPTSPFQPDAPEGWCWQEVLGLVNALNDVFFWDAQTGWAMGEKGTILHTDDGGETWQWQDSPVDGSLQRVVFVDAQTGWIAYPRWNDASVLLQTQDGGRTWVERSLPFQNDYDMTWTDANNGWLASSRKVFHSSDGGQTWQEQALPQQDQRWEFIASVDEQHVWVVTRDVILRTDDGGVTWTSYPLAQALSETPTYLEDLVFVDAQTGWAILGNNTIAHTTDGGRTWQAQYTAKENRIYRLDFEDARTGWAWNSDVIWRTTDGGATWEKYEMTPWNRRDVTFVDERRAWAVGGWIIGPRSTIAYSDDGGVTWQLWDQHIVVPPLAYTSAARLSSYLRQRAPPVDALLLRLFPDACWPFARYGLVSTALHNLGWNGTDWGEPPIVPQESHVRRLDADLDQDGQDEIILYGGGRRGTPLASVLDWGSVAGCLELFPAPLLLGWRQRLGTPGAFQGRRAAGVVG